MPAGRAAGTIPGAGIRLLGASHRAEALGPDRKTGMGHQPTLLCEIWAVYHPCSFLRWFIQPVSLRLQGGRHHDVSFHRRRATLQEAAGSFRVTVLRTLGGRLPGGPPRTPQSAPSPHTQPRSRPQPRPRHRGELTAAGRTPEV